MEINSVKGPAVVISASGMADAGRIKHHLRHNLWREGASIVFVGFQAQGTTGRKIVDGAQKVRIFNEEVAVKAKIFTINGFSAHAGQSQLLEWLGHFKTKGLQVFLIHGEYGAQQELAGLIREPLQLRGLDPGLSGRGHPGGGPRARARGPSREGDAADRLGFPHRRHGEPISPSSRSDGDRWRRRPGWSRPSSGTASSR